MMKRLKAFIERLSPPGYGSKRDVQLFIGWLTGAFLYSLINFIGRYSRAVDSLYYRAGSQRLRLIEGAMLPDFGALVRPTLIAFLQGAVIMLILIALRYAYYHRGSKSVYLMRRLPKSMEIHKQSIPLPVMAALIMLLAAFAVMLIYFAVYMHCSPEQCIPPDQWRRIWRF